MEKLANQCAGLVTLCSIHLYHCLWIEPYLCRFLEPEAINVENEVRKLIFPLQKKLYLY